MSEKPDTDDKRHGLTGLAKGLGKLSADKRRAALEMSAALAGVSLRVSREFVEAVPAAAELLSADDLRYWAELGRRLAMGNAETGASFFAAGVDALRIVPEDARSRVFQICTRQLVLSSSVSLETFGLIPIIAAEMNYDRFFSDVLGLAADISNRSAKHSSDFLKSTPGVAASLASFGTERDAVADSIVKLAAVFVHRTGGMAADLWAGLPAALNKLTAANAILLADRAVEFLE